MLFVAVPSRLITAAEIPATKVVAAKSINRKTADSCRNNRFSKPVEVPLKAYSATGNFRQNGYRIKKTGQPVEYIPRMPGFRKNSKIEFLLITVILDQEERIFLGILLAIEN